MVRVDPASWSRSVDSAHGWGAVRECSDIVYEVAPLLSRDEGRHAKDHSFTCNVPPGAKDLFLKYMGPTRGLCAHCLQISRQLASGVGMHDRQVDGKRMDDVTDVAVVGAESYRERIKASGRTAWPTIVALTSAGLTFVAEALLGWFTNWVDVGGWQAEAFGFPFFFVPFGVILTIVFSIVAGAGFGTKNRILGIVAGTVPLLGVLAMVLVTAIPGASPPSAG